MCTSVLEFIKNPNKYYFLDNQKIIIQDVPHIKLDDIVFLHVEEVTYEEKAPRKEALENVLSSVRIPGTNFIYLVLGDGEKVSFYYGLSRDLVQMFSLTSSIEDLGREILGESLKGNFRGSTIHVLSEDEKIDLLDAIEDMPSQSYISGVPGVSEDKVHFQGIDRLVDTMIHDKFAFYVVAKYLPYAVVQGIEKDIYQFYDMAAPYSKKSVQSSENTATTEVNTITSGSNKSKSVNHQEGKSKNHGESHSEQRSVNTNYKNDNETRTDTTGSNNNEGTWSESSSETNGNSTTTVNTLNKGINTTKGSSKGTSREFLNKDVQEWMKYIDEVLLKRLDYGKGKGIYISTIAIAAASGLSLKKLENTITALFSSDTGNKVPIMRYGNNINSKRLETIRNFQIPMGKFYKPVDEEERCIRSVLSQYAGHSSTFLGNWFSINELSIIAGLPQKEILGLSLKEEVEFGLNVSSDIPIGKELEIGNLIQSGQELKHIPVSINRDNLSRHMFVTGVTGSGKTTTCQKLLLESNLPFCVIEPVKTEYRILCNKYNDLLVFSLGKDKVTPFRLNPFEFFQHETIASHIDMIKASIEAAFDMEAAIPQIIETALYQCYEDCGWDVADDTNSLYKDPFAPGVYAFPTLAELIKKTEEVVVAQKFDDRLRDEYIGSIRARLMSLLVGSKGAMLNTYRSINFRDLLHRHIIFELEDIRSTEEKSLIMGFIISNFMEAIRAEYLVDPCFKHITLIEEAHRLLSRYQPGDSLTKKQGVEMFSNMLAEVRKYGESLIIVDQIPAKLATDVLKNTNTKIVHKIFAQDDKEAIGNTMAMSDEQKAFLSSLGMGRAVVFSQGWEKPVQVYVTRKTDTTSKEIISDDTIHIRCMDYLYANWNLGIIQGIDCLKEQPTKDFFEENLNHQNLYRSLRKSYGKCIDKGEISDEISLALKKLCQLLGKGGAANYIFKTFYYRQDEKCNKELLDDINYVLNEIEEGRIGKLSQCDKDLVLLLGSKRRDG